MNQPGDGPREDEIDRTQGKSPGRSDLPQPAWWQTDAGVAMLLCVASLFPFLHTLTGEFVYDDERQIVQNSFLRDPARYGQALLSDVWAFKGDREAAWSNYWRPTFVAWMILNANLFGLDSAWEWRCTNLVLHALVVASAFGFLRSLKVSRALAASIALLFATHPVHVESVAWISGSPDLLMSLGLLGSLRATVRWWSGPRSGPPFAAWIWFALGLLAKEAAILFPLAVMMLVLVLSSDHASPSPPNRIAQAWRVSRGFWVIAVLYFLARLQILGTIQIPKKGRSDYREAYSLLPGCSCSTFDSVSSLSGSRRLIP